jgi:large subunit ribosomal protein L5
MARLKEFYNNDVLKQLKDELGKKSSMEVPRFSKIVLNMGIGDAINNKAVLDSAAADLAVIAGQKPVKTKAKKAVSNFKLREDVPIGVKVTLRGNVMYEFLDRFINVALPRVRDFRGVNAKAFDGRGNFNMGIKEHIIFPELEMDKVQRIFGMNITFVTTASSDEDAKALITKFGFPFTK